jgi:uncharacterized cupredoxin-like copper-binding protein
VSLFLRTARVTAAIDCYRRASDDRIVPIVLAETRVRKRDNSERAQSPFATGNSLMTPHQLMLGLSASLLIALPPQHATSNRAAPRDQVTVVATDYSFAMPDTLPSGPTKFQLVNHGHELHHLFLVRLTNGKTVTDLAAAMTKPGPFPPWAIAEGGPDGADPATTSLATVVDLQAGRYAAVCIIPGPDEVPHMAKGMVHELVVTPSAREAREERKPSGVISLVDYGFQPSIPLSVGHHLVLVKNDGKQTHELEIAKLLPGKTPADLGRWAEKMSGPPPAQFLGGVSPIAPGHSNELALDLAPGHYVFLCFVPDAKDGKPHVAHGMVRDFVIT